MSDNSCTRLKSVFFCGNGDQIESLEFPPSSNSCQHSGTLLVVIHAFFWVPRANRHLNSARGDGVGKKGKVFHLSENRSQNTWQDKEGVGYFLPPTADVSEYQVSGNFGRGLNSAPQIIYSTMDQYKADSSVCVCIYGF